MNKPNFSWIPFYQELADIILTYKDNRTSLVEKVKLAHKEANKNLPKIEKDNEIIPDIDPFTVFALFNRGKQSDEARIALCTGYKKTFEVTSNVPSDFDGIPMFNYNQYCFYRYVGDPKREPECFDILWDLFEKALVYSKDSSNKDDLAIAFEKALSLSLIGLPKLTIALYQVRPYTFINLDNNNKRFLTDVDNMPHYFTTIFSSINRDIPNGSNYLFMCEQARNALKSNEYEYHSFPELSFHAYADEKKTETLDIDSNIKETSYWIYSPGDNACMWDDFYKNGIMGIGWDEVTNLKDFASKEEIKEFMKKVYDASYS